MKATAHSHHDASSVNHPLFDALAFQECFDADTYYDREPVELRILAHW